MSDPNQPEGSTYEDQLLARERASRRAWTDDQRRRVAETSARARAQRRHDWRAVDPSRAAPVEQTEAPRSASPSEVLALEVAAAALGALHVALSTAFVVAVTGPAWSGALATASSVVAVATAAAVTYGIWPFDRRQYGGHSRPVERLLAGIVAGGVAGWLVAVAWNIVPGAR